MTIFRFPSHLQGGSKTATGVAGTGENADSDSYRSEVSTASFTPTTKAETVQDQRLIQREILRKIETSDYGCLQNYTRV
jgi:hypothetical protein